MHDLIYLLLEIRRAVCSAEEPDVAPGSEVFVQCRTLGHVPYPLPQLGPVLERVQPHHPRRAAGGPQRSDETLDQGGLPCSVRPYQTEHLAPANREVHAPQRLTRPYFLVKPETSMEFTVCPLSLPDPARRCRPPLLCAPRR